MIGSGLEWLVVVRNGQKLLEMVRVSGGGLCGKRWMVGGGGVWSGQKWSGVFDNTFKQRLFKISHQCKESLYLC